MSITLTIKAANHIIQNLNKRGRGVGLRLSVYKSGCSGLSYKLEYADKFLSKDKIFKTNGVNIIVNEKNLIYLDGIELDFIRDGVNEGFKFNNPNAKNKCGCGKSFQT